MFNKYIKYKKKYLNNISVGGSMENPLPDIQIFGQFDIFEKPNQSQIEAFIILTNVRCKSLEKECDCYAIYEYFDNIFNKVSVISHISFNVGAYIINNKHLIGNIQNVKTYSKTENKWKPIEKHRVWAYYKYLQICKDKYIRFKGSQVNPYNESIGLPENLQVYFHSKDTGRIIMDDDSIPLPEYLKVPSYTSYKIKTCKYETDRYLYNIIVYQSYQPPPIMTQRNFL